MISGNAGMLRLKRGVMKYIAVPGKLELEIYAYCEKHGVQSCLLYTSWWMRCVMMELSTHHSNMEILKASATEDILLILQWKHLQIS